MYFPEELWREIKSYYIIKKFNIGDYLTFFVPSTVSQNEKTCGKNMYESFLEGKEGMVVGVKKDFHPRIKRRFYTYYISMPSYKGDYSILHSENNIIKLHKKKIDVFKKLSIVGKFDDWWYGIHKELYQSLLIDALIN